MRRDHPPAVPEPVLAVFFFGQDVSHGDGADKALRRSQRPGRTPPLPDFSGDGGFGNR